VPSLCISLDSALNEGDKIMECCVAAGSIVDDGRRVQDWRRLRKDLFDILG
jgi:hypothetical protein